MTTDAPLAPDVLWAARGRKIAGPWRRRAHPAGDVRGIWLREAIHGGDAAWIEAPPLRLVQEDRVDTFLVPLRADVVASIVSELQPDLSLDDPRYGWPTLFEDLAREDDRLREKGWELVNALPRRRVTPSLVAPRLVFGGRRRGQACGCGGTLEATRHEGVAAPGWTLDCDTCDAAYDEEGNHWCPKCEAFRGGWWGGTDADPRPACPKCNAPQPGWPR